MHDASAVAVFDDPTATMVGLRSIKQRQHDVIALQVMDRAEIVRVYGP